MLVGAFSPVNHRGLHQGYLNSKVTSAGCSSHPATVRYWPWFQQQQGTGHGFSNSKVTGTGIGVYNNKGAALVLAVYSTLAVRLLVLAVVSATVRSPVLATAPVGHQCWPQPHPPPPLPLIKDKKTQESFSFACLNFHTMQSMPACRRTPRTLTLLRVVQADDRLQPWA